MVLASPRISICIPTHALTSQILRSMRVIGFSRELLELVEVVLVHDGQPESEWASAVAEAYGISLRQYSQPKAGPAAARNLAASHARSDNLIFCDSDVVITPDAVLAALDTQPGELIVPRIDPTHAGRVAQFFSEYVFAPRHENGRDYSVSAFWVMHKSDFLALGGFDENYLYPAGEDTDFMIRWGASGRKLSFADDLVVFHRNPSTISELVGRAVRYGRHSNASVLRPSDASERAMPLASLVHLVFRAGVFGLSLITGRGGSHVHRNRLLTVIWVAAWQYGHLTRPRR